MRVPTRIPKKGSTETTWLQPRCSANMIGIAPVTSISGARSRRGCSDQLTKLHVQDAITKAGIQGHQCTDGGHQQLERPDQKLAGQFFDRDIPLLEFGMKRPITTLMPETSSLVHQETWRVRFIQECHTEHQNKELEDPGKVFGPAPAEVGLYNQGSRNYRPEHWS